MKKYRHVPEACPWSKGMHNSLGYTIAWKSAWRREENSDYNLLVLTIENQPRKTTTVDAW